MKAERVSFYTWCPCHAVIGLTDGASLFLAGMEIRRPVVLWCSCGGATQWRPYGAAQLDGAAQRAEREPVPEYHHPTYREEQP